MRVLVCGSRDWGDEDTIAERLAELEPCIIVHGDASRKVWIDGRWQEQSADTLAAGVARLFGLPVEPHPARWADLGKAAGFIRNNEMLDSGIDLVLAFQRNDSRGTQHTIDGARKRGIPVEVVSA